MKTYLIFFAFLISPLLASAQLERTLHQTFELGEATDIQMDIAGEVEYVMWAGNTLMTETKVLLYDGSKAILTHLVEEAKRYDIKADTSAVGVSLVSVDKVRERIKSKKGSCTETVKVKVYIPEDFVEVGPAAFRRKE